MFVWCLCGVCVRFVCACGKCGGVLFVIMVWCLCVWCVCLGCVCVVVVYGMMCVWNGVRMWCVRVLWCVCVRVWCVCVGCVYVGGVWCVCVWCV